MRELQETHEAHNRLTKRSLTRELFGATSVSGSDAISMRDALDRADSLNSPGQALELLDRAERSGDRHLAQAVAQR